MTQRAISARSVRLHHTNPYGAILLVCGFAALLWGGVTWMVGRELARDGDWTTAQVTSRDSYTSPQTSNRTYRIRYRYTDAQGQEHLRSLQVGRARYSQTRTGQSLRVRYLPANPSISETEFEDRDMSGFYVMLGGLVGLVLGGGVLIHERPRMAARLRAAKAPGAAARVVAHHPGRGSTRARPLIAFDWQEADGQRGTSAPVVEGRAPPVGSSVRIRRDPVTGQAWWEDELG